VDSCDALWIISVLDEYRQALAHAEDQQFLDDLADALHDGRRTPLTEAEQARICACAREVGMWWIDDWLRTPQEDNHA
jgi:hypothetical protein